MIRAKLSFSGLFRCSCNNRFGNTCDSEFVENGRVRLIVDRTGRPMDSRQRRSEDQRSGHRLANEYHLAGGKNAFGQFIAQAAAKRRLIQ